MSKTAVATVLLPLTHPRAKCAASVGIDDFLLLRPKQFLCYWQLDSGRYDNKLIGSERN